MQLTPMLFYIMFAIALFGGGGALLHMMPPPKGEAPLSGERVASAEPKAKQPEALREQSKQRPAPSIEQSGSGPQTEGQPGPVAPSFDVVRIESGGDGVVAGRAEPGWTVIIEANEREVARTTADEFGEWTVVLAEPLPPGDYSIGLRALAKGGARGLSSEEHVSVSIAGRAGAEKTVVALSKPGEATRVLTPSEPAAQPAEPAQASAAKATAGAPGSGQAETAAVPATGEPAGGKSPEVEQKPVETAALPQQEAKPAPASPEVAVSFSSVDYEAADGGGRLFLSGQATAGARVKLYLDNRSIGEAVAGQDGAWSFESRRDLPSNTQHRMRADAIQADGQVASRAEVEFTPPVVAEPETQVAARAEPPTVTAATPPVRSESPATVTTARQSAAASATPSAIRPQEAETAAGAGKQDGQEPAAVAGKPRESAAPDVVAATREPGSEPDAGQKAVLAQKRSIVVRRGDTLWHIAERRYGSGIRYTAIYRDNRDQIRDPHWIYPGQEFSLPQN